MTISSNTARAAGFLAAVCTASLLLTGAPAQAGPVPTHGTVSQETADVERPQGRPGPLEAAATTEGSAASAPAAQSAGAPITRSEVIARAKTWVDARVPYSRTDYRGGYRTDCSGLVSMAWNLGSNHWTGDLDTYATRISKNELRKGDMLLFHNAADPVRGSHVVIFESWADSSMDSYIGIEQTPPNTVRRVIPYAYFKNSGSYVPYRYDNIVDDESSEQGNGRIAAAASGTAVRLDILGSESALYDTTGDYAGGGWTRRWDVVGSPVKAVTSVVVGNTLHVYAVGTDGRVYTKDSTGGGPFTDWMPVPGGAEGARGISVAASGSVVHLTILGSDGAVYYTEADYAPGGGWANSWSRIGSPVKAITSASVNNTLHLYAIGTDDRVYTKDSLPGGQWSEWTEVPGGAMGARGISAAVSGSLVHLTILGSDSAAYYTDAGYAPGGRWADSWTLVGSPVKAITSVSVNNTLHLYAIGTDGRIYTKDSLPGAQWSEWTEVPGGAGTV